MISRLRDGSVVETYDGEARSIEFLYGSGFGRGALKILVAPWVSHLAGAFLDCPLSAGLVKGFIKKNKLDMSPYPQRDYESFNDFFTRKILPGRRVFAEAEEIFPSPCDGKASVFPLEEDTHFTIKGCDYTLNTLLRNEHLAEKYKGGWGILLRLTVDDYHRYAYPVSGRKSGNKHINGVYHTVNPRAAEALPIYQENTREYTLIRTKDHGTFLMMEIGAMLVGRIKNLHGEKEVVRGEEKGYFEFGGSSVIVLTQKDRFVPDEDIRMNSQNGEETVVKMGEGIGTLV